MKKISLAFSFVMMLVAHSLMADLNVNMSLNPVNGDTIAAWENYDITGPQIYASIQQGSTWYTSDLIADPLTYPRNPHTAINDNDDMVVIWIGYDNPSFVPSLYASTYSGTPPLGTWTTVQISDPTLEYVLGDHQVKVSSTGVVVVTWASNMIATGLNETRGVYAPTYGTFPAAVNIP